MTVSNTTNKTTRAVGNGSTTAFTFPFKIFAAGDLEVRSIDVSVSPEVSTLKTLTTDYTVTINAVTEGGTVTYVTAPTSDDEVFIKRVVTLEQDTDIPVSDSFPQQAVEDALDRRSMVTIQLNEENDRAITQSVTSTSTADLTLPEPVASNAIGWNGTATALVNLTSADLGTSVASAYGETLMTSADSAGARTVLDLDDATATVSWLASTTVTGTVTGTLTASGSFVTDKFKLAAATQKTIATAAITVDNGRHTVDTEADAATDALDTINGLSDGDFVILSAENITRVVTISEADNCKMQFGPFIMAAANDRICFMGDGASALEVWRSSTTETPAKVLLSTQEASTSATIDFINLSSTFKKYVIEAIDVKLATDDIIMNVRTSTDNGSTYDAGASDYSWRVMNPNSFNEDLADTEISIVDVASSSRRIGNAAGEYFNATIEIFNPSNAATFTIIGSVCHYSSADGDAQVSSGTGSRESAADVDAVRLLASSGNITSGTFKLYGIR